ncbi:Alpha/Beta hydrolase protein [Melanogaster broomeanus]|nr:Alpha/Beta hydrolase protein [Melanogaster broomeanus]
MTEAPFSIAVPDEKLVALRRKLALTDYPDELDDAGWKYGAPMSDIQRLVGRWKDGYDWRKYEAELNEELPMFTQDVEVHGFGSLNIHYVHKKSETNNAAPLLFVHGWPGSFYEVRKILPLLTTVSLEHPSFHVVALSLPGYGFSEAPRKQGFAQAQYAEVGHKLMLALGYDEYVTQGGDWGFVVTREIATLYAWHTNFPIAPPPTIFKNPFAYLTDLLSPISAEDKAGQERTAWMRRQGMGYSPQTLGYALADSPVGLLAWIYEKLHHWTDAYQWDDDEVLTWVSIYYFSRAGPAASLRIYYEISDNHIIDPPSRDLYFPENVRPCFMSLLSRLLKSKLCRWARRAYRVVFESSHSSGGHFAAHEKPGELVMDLREMFGNGGPAYGVVPGKTGYA